MSVARLMTVDTVGTTYWIHLHGPWEGSGENRVEFKAPVGFDLTDDFHNYWITRKQDWIQIGVDDKALATWTPASLPAGTEGQWPFNRPL